MREGGGREAVLRGTTIVAVRDGAGHVAMAGDGQITQGAVVVKHCAVKIRRLYKDRVLVGFAGATADSLTLLARFEEQLDRFQGDLARTSVELAKQWRTDRYLRRLDSLLVAADTREMYLVSGSGDVIAPDEPFTAVGSGAPYALAALKALTRHTSLPAADLAREALRITASLCIYTNEQVVVECL